MNILKQIFFALIVVFSFWACSETLEQIEENGAIINRLEQDGFNYELSVRNTPYIESRNASGTEQFYLSVYKSDNKNMGIDAILVKENIDENNYILYHYTDEKILFATLYFGGDILKDVKLEFEDESIDSRSLSSWYACANKRYKDYMSFYDNEHPIMCALGDMFFGACTIGGILSGTIECLF